MNFVVYGAGAVGSVLGGMLSLRVRVMLGAALWTVGLVLFSFGFISWVFRHHPDMPFLGRRGSIHFVWASHAGLVFLIAAAAVAGGDTPAFDEWIMHALREPGDLSNPIGPPWFEEAVRDVTALGSTVVLTFAVVVAAGYLWMTDAPAKAAFLIAAVSMGALFKRLLVRKGVFRGAAMRWPLRAWDDFSERAAAELIDRYLEVERAAADV